MVGTLYIHDGGRPFPTALCAEFEPRICSLALKIVPFLRFDQGVLDPKSLVLEVQPAQLLLLVRDQVLIFRLLSQLSFAVSEHVLVDRCVDNPF